MNGYNWVPLFGEFILLNDKIIFKGKQIEQTQPDGSTKPGPSIGHIMCDKLFSGGEITVEVEFNNVAKALTMFQVVLYYNPHTYDIDMAGIGSIAAFSVNSNNIQSKWKNHAVTGDIDNVSANKKHLLNISLEGSLLSLKFNGVKVLQANFPYNLPQSQVGIWCADTNEICIHNFTVDSKKPKAFIVMQFTSPYNEIYHDVIDRICKSKDVEAIRVDDSYGPGLIIADIKRYIMESTLIIADITPDNPNVYYEVGYAHGLNKPTILIAEKGRSLPFDVSPFRTLFYENSIGGKMKLEEGLQEHINAILKERS